MFTPHKDESGCVRVISWQSAVNSNISPFFNCSYVWPNIDDIFCKIRRQKNNFKANLKYQASASKAEDYATLFFA